MAENKKSGKEEGRKRKTRKTGKSGRREDDEK
jgi:hypothetical protein